MISLVCLWFLAGFTLWWYISRYRNASSGLVIAYFVVLSMNHLPGGMIYALPWYAPMNAYLLSQGTNLKVVQAGFLESVIGLWAFVGGVIIFSPLLLVFFGVKRNQRPFTPHPKLPITYLTVAIVINFLVYPIFRNIPSFSAFFKMSWYLIIVSVSLLIWQSYLMGRRDLVSRWLQKAGIFLPAVTVVMDGFLGYGITAFMSIFIFYLSVFRIRKSTMVKLILMAYLGFSLFVSYKQQRDAIRAVVWYGGSAVGISQKIDAVSKIFTEFTFFNPKDNKHLEVLDERLNQNLFVGQAVEFLHEKNHPFAQGATVRDAFISIIPRVLWPDKPMKAGSGNLVATYTGREFAQGTSFGVGQVMEFYINFGTNGVIVGFLVFGAIIGLIDQMAILKLKQGNWQGFAFWFLPGMAMMQAGGSLMEVITGSAAGFVFILALNKTFLSRMISKPASIERN